MTLLVDYCDYKAAKYAVEKWHYSYRMPKSKMNTFGVWENKNYIGVVIFSYGATPQIGSPYGLSQFEIVELSRVALKNHVTQVSKMLSLAVAKLKKHNKDLRLIISFADMEQDHYGVIYQASNWLYLGSTKPRQVGFIVKGKKVHTRTIGLKPGGIQSLKWVRSHLDKDAEEWRVLKKHRYAFPLDRAMRRQITPLAQPYPKRADG